MFQVSKKFWGNIRVAGGVVGAVAVVYGLLAPLPYLSIVGIIVLLIVYYFSQRNSRLKEAWLNHYLDTVVRNIDRANNYALHKIPVGIAVFDKEGSLQWKNELFETWVGGKADEGDSFSAILPAPDNNFDTLSLKDADKDIRIGEKYFSMLVRRIKITEDGAQDNGLVIFLLDTTDREVQKAKFKQDSICLAYLQFDNYNDVLKGLNESTRANLTVDVTKAVGQWADEMKGIFLKYADDLYMVCLTRKALQETMARKFDVMDRVREIKVGNKIAPTVSLGVAGGDWSLAELSEKAQAGLDLSLGRGGDQASVSLDGELQFFGAKSSVQAKSTRVRARIVAQAIHELMTNADKIFIMGHVNEDYDSLGAAVGVAKMSMSLNKETYVVHSGQGSSFERLQDLVTDLDEQYKAIFVDEDQALAAVTKDSILILVDHHRAMLTASPKVLAAIPKRVIIDHHRQAEDIIQKAVLQYLEPSSSSTSELVTEILRYFNDRMDFTPLEATALYAGILVDTKNFAVQTGERTFEAAALLRREGADPSMVSELFKDDQATILARAQVVASMEIPIPGLAMSVYQQAPEGYNTSIIIAQAADELLTMDAIHVSVVMSEGEGLVGISARSDGSVNVQIILEELGGGGHQTVAGVKVAGVTVAELREKIIAMAREQLEKQPVNEERDNNESNIDAGRQEIG